MSEREGDEHKRLWVMLLLLLLYLCEGSEVKYIIYAYNTIYGYF